MGPSNPVILGAALLGLGLALLVAGWLVARPVARWIRRRAGPVSLPVPVDLEPPDQAIIVAHPGGRVAYVNDLARQWFGLDGGAPDLWRMAERARPQDLFLELCTDEGQASLSIGDLPVEAVSHRIQLAAEASVVVTFTRMGGSEAGFPVEDLLQADALLAFNHHIMERGDLAGTARAALEVLPRFMAMDMLELNLWDPVTQTLTPMRAPSRSLPAFTSPEAQLVYRPGEGLTGWIAEQRQPLFIPDINHARDLQPKVDLQRFPFRAYVGVPLIYDRQFMGTLEAAHAQPDAYDQRHRKLLELLGAQLAVALHAAETHEAQLAAQETMEGLAELAGLLQQTADRDVLIERLSHLLSGLLHVEFSGVLVLDPERHQLVAQTPFKGLSDPFVQEWLALPVPDGGPAAAWLASGRPHSPVGLGGDQVIHALGLDTVARQTGWEQVALVPLLSGGKAIGALLFADTSPTPRLLERRQSLMMDVAAQCTVLLVHADLMARSDRALLRAESLRRIAARAASTASLDEILAQAVHQLARALPGETGLALLAAPGGERFEPLPASCLGIDPSDAELSLPRKVFQRLADKLEAATPVVLETDAQPAPPEVLLDFMRLRGMPRLLVVPLVVEEQVEGAILIEPAPRVRIDDEAIDLAQTIADQVASAIARQRRPAPTDQALRRQAQQSSALAHLGAALTEPGDRIHALGLIHRAGMEAFDAQCGWTVQFDPGAGARRPLVVVGDDPEHPAPDPEALADLAADPATRVLLAEPGDQAAPAASLILPLGIDGTPVGLMSVHGSTPGAFDEAAQGFAPEFASAAGAVISALEQRDEATKSSEIFRRRTAALAGLLAVTQAEAQAESAQATLSSLAEALVAMTDAEGVHVLAATPRSERLTQAYGSGPAPKGFPETWDDLMQRLQGLAPRGPAYVVPAIPDAGGGEPTPTLTILPVLSSAGRPLGVLFLSGGDSSIVDDPAGRSALHAAQGLLAGALAHPDSGQITLELARPLAGPPQAEGMPPEASGDEREAYIATLLATDRILQAASTYRDEAGILNAFLAACRIELAVDTAMVVEVGPSGLTLVQIQSEPMPAAKLEPLLGQYNPLNAALTDGRPVLSAHVADDKDWMASPLLRALDSASAMAFPVWMSGQIDQVVLLSRSGAAQPFTQIDVTLLRRLSDRLGEILGQARLLRRVEDRLAEGQMLIEFGRTIGSLDLDSILNQLADGLRRAMPSTQTSLICLWHPESNELVATASSGFMDPSAAMEIRLRPGEGIAGQVYASGRTRVWTAIEPAKDLNYSQTSLERYHKASGGLVPASALGVPLRAESGILGTITLENYASPGGFTQSDADFVASLAAQAALSVQNARLFEQTQQSSQELERRVGERTEDLAREHVLTEALLRITVELASSLDLDRVLNRALALVNEVVGADRGVILLMAPDSDRLVLRASLGGTDDLPEGGRPSPYMKGEGLAGWIIENGESVIIDDLVEDERWVRYRDHIEEHRSALAVPLLVSDDSLGAMMMFSQRTRAFNDDQLRLLNAAGHQVAAAVNNAELYRLIRDQAERLGTMLREQQVEASKSRAILESIADGVIVTEQEHRVILCNASAGQILNLDQAAVLDQPAVDFIGVYGAAGRRWVEAVQRWRSQSAEDTSRETPLEERLELDDGRIVAVSVAPVVLGDEFLGTVSIFRDITQEVEVDRLKSEFVATVSHELRTPMTSVKGYVEMLLMQAVGELNDEQQRFLQIIKGNIDRLGGLVNDLLDISRIESGRVALDLQPVDLAAMLGDVREAVLRRSQIETKPMEVTLKADEGLPSVLADSDRLRQVINNLVENSFNYTPAGGHIWLSLERAQGCLEVRIRDNGIGIKPEEQKRVFERFYRGEQALNLAVAGTGLGLSIVRQLVEMHDGTLQLESEGVPGKGCTFIITLPIAPRHGHPDGGNRKNL